MDFAHHLPPGDRLESGLVSHIVEDRFHQRAVKRRSTVEGGNDRSPRIADRAETSVAGGTWIELVCGIHNIVYPVHFAAPLPGEECCVQWSGRRLLICRPFSHVGLPRPHPWLPRLLGRRAWREDPVDACHPGNY